MAIRLNITLMTSAPTTTREEGTRITVLVRVRPPNQREAMSALGNVIHVIDDRVLIFDPPGERIQKQTFLSTSKLRAKNLHFGFDKVLGNNSSQEDVFDVVKDTIFSENGLLDGFNCTVFAYGATGSGKTFSMAGTPENPGIMSRSVEYIFQKLDERKGQHKLRLSYLEIYNEQIRDLLVSPDEKQADLKIVEDPQHGCMVTNLKYCYPDSTDEVLRMIQVGNNRRTQAQTDANPVSSRSHAVCQIEIENCEDYPGIATTSAIGKLSLIDLAGSERATTNTGIRLKESSKINCSLLALSNCINALCVGNAQYIPFRGSKLTRLLKDSLGGNCKTVCLSCVSPSYMTYEDTYSTLQYANKTKNIKTNVTRNTLNVKARISQYPKIIAELRAQLQAAQTTSCNFAAVDSFTKQIQDSFITTKHQIQTIYNRESKIDTDVDIKQQILAIQRMSHSDLKKKTQNKINEFTQECKRKRPQTASPQNKLIDTEQKARILELENIALQGQVAQYEKQIQMQQNVIRALSQAQLSNTCTQSLRVIETPEVPTHQLVKKPYSSIELPAYSIPSRNENSSIIENEQTNSSIIVKPPMPSRVNKSVLITTAEKDSENSKSFSYKNEKPSPRRENSESRLQVYEINKSKIGYSNTAASLLRQKIQENQRIQSVHKNVLQERCANGTVNSVISKPPVRVLMDQLSQKAAAMNISIQSSNKEEPAGLLLRSRLLTQKIDQ